MVIMTVTKSFRFEAAHSLPHLPEGHKCRNLHGHSYEFEVHVTGPVDGRGFVVDYAEISAEVQPIIDRLDHQNLDHIFPFRTTAENIAAWIGQQIALPVSRIVFRETSTTSVIWEPEEAIKRLQRERDEARSERDKLKSRRCSLDLVLAAIRERDELRDRARKLTLDIVEATAAGRCRP